jgi:DMSO reductase anchor subunit
VLIGLSLAVWFAANHPEQSRDTVLASIVAKVLAGVIVLFWVFLARIDLPSPWLLLAAVVVQVLFVLGEAAYLLSHTRRAEDA